MEMDFGCLPLVPIGPSKVCAHLPHKDKFHTMATNNSKACEVPETLLSKSHVSYLIDIAAYVREQPTIPCAASMV